MSIFPRVKSARELEIPEIVTQAKNTNATVCADGEERMIAGDDGFGVARESTFQDAVVRLVLDDS